MSTNLTLTMLHSIFPLANVYLSVSPCHFANSVSIIMLELTFVDITIGPMIDPIAISLILVVLALKKLSVFAFPLSTSFTLPIHKLPVIFVFITPDVMAISMRLIIHIFSFVCITITEVLKPPSFFYKDLFRAVDVFLAFLF